jgi:tight adherence protein C
MNELTLAFATACVSLTVAMIAWYIWQYVQNLTLARMSERGHMDPLPPLVKIIWPFVAYYMRIMPQRSAEKKHSLLQARIDAAGLHYTIKPEEFIGLRFAAVTIGILVGLMCCACKVNSVINMPFAFNILVGIAFAGIGFIYPDSWLSGAKKKYTRQVMRSLPGYLDMITMCCEAGLNLNGALQQAVNKGQPGPLRTEFERVLREMRAGVVRTEALRNMAERMDNAVITNLVSNIIQSELMGASLATTLRSIADLRRMERFQVAEKAAMEAPVKMIFPLVMFIFPVTFMIIAFPLIMKAREVL